MAIMRFNHVAVLQARLDLGLTQEEVAAACSIDVRTYRRYESGEVNVGEPFAVRHVSRRRLLRRFCEELGIPESDLVESAPSVRTLPGAAPDLGPRIQA